MKLLILACLALLLSISSAQLELAGFAAEPPNPTSALITKLDSVVNELNWRVDSNMDEHVLSEPQPVFHAKQDEIRKLSRKLRELVQKITDLWPQLNEVQRNSVRESLRKLEPFTKTIYWMDTHDNKLLDNEIFHQRRQ